MTLAPPPVRYAPARSGETWPEAVLAGLEADPSGDLYLLGLPGVSPPWLENPADLGASGLALDNSCGLYVADTTGNRILRIGLDCATELVLSEPESAAAPGVLDRPSGLAVGANEWLYVANTGGSTVLVFSTPDLTLRDVWTGFDQPIAVACHDGLVLVVELGAKRVRRFDAIGAPDPTFDALVTPPAGPADPRAVAVGSDGTIYFGDAATGSVWRFDWSGNPAGPPVATGTQPRALAVRGGVLYVGDALSGHVHLYAVPNGDPIGAVGGFSGPVTALAVGQSSLFVKAGLGSAYVTARYASSFAPSGSLVYGPLDAGKEVGWSRAAVKCRRPAETAVRLEWYLDDTPTPATVVWQTAPALDLLLESRRYLWLRATLMTRDPAVSPTLLQVQAQTAGDSYLDYLPFVYTHDPDRPGLTAQMLQAADPAEFAPGDLAYLRSMYAQTPVEGEFVVRLLGLAQAELDDLDRAVADLPTLFDPATAPSSMLRWLASWLGFDLPPRFADGAHPDEVRRLLLGLAALYRRRGTVRGVADFVEVYSGVRPQLFEEFNARPLWMLGESVLGFGLGLPDRDLEGVIVGESVVGEAGPEDPGAVAGALFASTAHRFSVLVPAGGRLDEAARDLVVNVVEQEKPAHTGYHICFTEPRMRVGVQARVGLDAVLAAEPEPMTLGDEATLGLDTRLTGPAADAVGAVGAHGQLGIETRLG
jgi:phage tail-like protein